MSLYRDKQIKGFLLFLISFTLLFIGIGIALAIYQVNNLEVLWLMHDEAVVSSLLEHGASKETIATVYKGNIIKNLIMDCQSYTKYRPNETTGGIFVSWRRKEELPTGA